MIPKYSTNRDVKISNYPTKTYRIDFENKRIVGMVDGVNAMAQAVEKICRTERYSERIYSGDYGIELNRLVGASLPFVEANLELTFSDAFLSDDRIFSINDLSLSKVCCDELTAFCRVVTADGEINASVMIGR